MQEKIRLLIRNADPLVTMKQKTQIKSCKTMAKKSTSMRKKLQNTSPDNINIRSTLDTLVSLPPLEYDIVDDMEKNLVNINLFELAK